MSTAAPFATSPAFGYTPATPQPSCRGQSLQNTAAGIGVLKITAAQSRNLRRSCGFFVSGHRFGGPNVGPQGRRFSSSAVVPVRQPVWAASLIGVEVAVFQLTTKEPFMATLPTMGAPAPALTVVDGIPTTTSADLAGYFGKRHDRVLEAIRNLLAQLPSEHHPNFREMLIDIEIGQGATRRSPAYRITRDGFTLLAMGFTGKRALQFKLAYIDAFNRLEAAAQKQADSRRLAIHHTAPGVDVQALLSGQPAPVVVQLPRAVEDAINKHAWALAGQAHELLRAHITQRMHYRHVGGYPQRTLDVRAALADIPTITLGHALAHTAREEMQHALTTIATAVQVAQAAHLHVQTQLAATQGAK